MKTIKRLYQTCFVLIVLALSGVTLADELCEPLDFECMEAVLAELEVVEVEFDVEPCETPNEDSPHGCRGVTREQLECWLNKLKEGRDKLREALITNIGVEDKVLSADDLLWRAHQQLLAGLDLLSESERRVAEALLAAAAQELNTITPQDWQRIANDFSIAFAAVNDATYKLNYAQYLLADADPDLCYIFNLLLEANRKLDDGKRYANTAGALLKIVMTVQNAANRLLRTVRAMY